MNKDAIKKALVYCASDSIDDCKACPYADNGPFACSISMYKDACALITEQEKEIERLRTTLGQCNTELNSALESLKSQCREIGELKDDYAKLQELFAQYQMASDKEIRAQIKQAKIDVLYELKEKRTTVFIDIDKVDEAVFIDDIDELLKEYKK